MTRIQWDILRTSLALNADFYHFHDPELLPVGLILRALGRRTVYDVHEEFPKQILSKGWIPRPLRPIVSQIAGFGEYWMSRAMTGIVASAPAIATRFPADRCVVVQNFPLISELAAPADLESATRLFQVAYVGGIGRIRGIVEVVRAMELLPTTCEARLALVGRIHPADLEVELRKMPGFKRVDFLGWKSREEVARILAQSRVGIVTFLPEPHHVGSQPTKLFEYMSASLPVIASDFPHSRQIVEGAGSGILVDPTNPQAIADAIQWIMSHPEESAAMGKRGQQSVHEVYNWENEARTLLGFYNEFNQKDSDCRGSATTVHQGVHCEPSNRREPEIAGGDRSHGTTL
jgi:glycosyltransferase involved in cell wall biosynthesis